MRVKFRLRIERGAGPRVELVVTGESITIGRDPSAGFVVDDAGVSPVHCEIHRSDQGFAIRDLDSHGGTRLSGVEVREACLHDDARIALGATELSFATLDAETPPSTRPASRRRRYARTGRRTDVTALPFKDAKSKIVERFEREYVAAMLEQCGGNITAAAQTAELHRVHFLRLMDRYGMRRVKPKSI